jgi:hypothetical protein
MIFDETGHLLPALFSQMHRETLIENGDPAQFARLQAVLVFPDIDLCIHGRCIRGEALQTLAELVRANPGDSVAAARELLTGQVDVQVYRRLVKECDSFRSAVKHREQTSGYPPGGWWWKYQYYDSIAVFESLGREGIKVIPSQTSKRPWWRFW